MEVTPTNIRLAQNQIDTLTTDNFELQSQIEQLTKELSEAKAENREKSWLINDLMNKRKDRSKF